MGEFQRSRSKVWWSNYLEADTEDDEPHHGHLGWGGAGLVLSPSRGSSSSPSSSHKSQDSGFSDSEASSTPGCTVEQLKSSPLSNKEDERNESPTNKSCEIVDNQYCECPSQGSKDNTDQSDNGQNSVEPKSTIKILKGQFFSQCSCLGQKAQVEVSFPVDINGDGKESDKSSENLHNGIDISSQLPVKKLREKFLQDCICLAQTKQQSSDKGKDSLSTQKSLQKAQVTSECTLEPASQDSKKANEENISVQIAENNNNEVTRSNKNCENLSTVTPPTAPELCTKASSSLSRSVPVPKIRSPPKHEGNGHKESPTRASPVPSPRSLKNENKIRSPIPSPRSSKNKNTNNSQCKNNTQCIEKQSPSQTPNSLNNSQEPQSDSNSSPNRRDCTKKQGSTLSLPQINQSSISEATSENKEFPSTRTVCSEIPDHLGSPTHTSTPKTLTTSPNKLLATPNRPLRCLGLGRKNGRPVNLLNNFASNPQPESQSSEKGPVQHWLSELATLYEPECMNTLQSKSLAVDLSHQVAAMAAVTTDTVKILQDNTKLISTEFAKLCQQLEYDKMEHIGPLVQNLVGHMTEFLKEHCDKQNNNTDLETEVKTLVEACDQLRLTAAKQPPDKEELSSQTATVGNKFTTIVDNILIKHISVLVGVLDEPTSDLALRSALSSLTTLGLEGSHLSRLVAQCSGVRALLTVCLESHSSSIRTSALRALATICCVVEAIRQLEQAGGVEILSDILAEESKPEPEVSEAAAVVAQITAPWVEDNHSVQGLSEQLPSLVNSLTRLASNTASCETLLLAAAALANLTFMEPRTVWPLLQHGTAGKLLQAVKKRGPKVSVFLQEQAATLLANMAAVPESRPHLADQRAVVALLCFLQIRHSPLQRAPEIAAAERVQQKSAIALSRLCSDPVVAAQVVELQGVNRLVRLCKEERERNHSDGVLVACLAALRKIAANCGTKVIEDLDAMELVEPRLLDSFLIYSSRQESYV